MQAQPLTVSVDYAQALLEAGGLPPAQAAQFLARLHLPNDRGARLSEQQFATLYRALSATLDDEMLGLLPRPVRQGALKFACLALLDARSLEGALHRWSWMYRVVQDDVALELMTPADGTARIAVGQAGDARSHRPLGADLMLKVIHGVSSWLTGRRLPLIRVDFHFPRPPWAADYEVLYPGPVHFDQPRSSLVMDAKLLQLPVRRSRPQLDDFLRRAPEDWMFARPRTASLFALRLRDHVIAHLGEPVTAETAAAALAVSVRTLHRHLADEGTSFRAIRDECRRDQAIKLLARSELPVGSVGTRLGFESTAAFHRAFRSWTGSTPGEFRDHGVVPR